MTDCPKSRRTSGCIQEGRLAAMEVSQKRDEEDFAELKKCVKEIHASVVGNGRKGLNARVARNSIYLKLIGAAIVLIPTLAIAYAALTK